MAFSSKQIDHINVLLDPNESDASRLGSLKWLTTWTNIDGTTMISWEIWPSAKIREMTDAEMRLKRILGSFKELLG
jgi:hypothetical protein